MIAKDELDKAVEIAKKYEVGELYLIRLICQGKTFE